MNAKMSYFYWALAVTNRQALIVRSQFDFQSDFKLLGHNETL